MVDQLSSFASEVTRVAREVGTDGKLGGQAEVRGVGGGVEAISPIASELHGRQPHLNQVRNIAERDRCGSFKGDLSTKITVDARGEILELKNTINTMVDQLNAFASGSEARVAREVGTDAALRRPSRSPAARGGHVEGPH